MATVLFGLIAIMVFGALAGAISVGLRRYRPQRADMHALRDDHAAHPLAVPLRQGFGSLEIGVRLDSAGRLRVGGTEWPESGGCTIGPMVLRDLAMRAAAHGGDIRPGQTDSILLMIEILETEPARQVRAYDVLDGEVRRYPGLCTRFTDGRVTMGPVTIVLVGTGVPRHAVAASNDRYAFCDGSFGDVGPWGAPLELVPTVSEHWSWRFAWDGKGTISNEERRLLNQLVRTAHQDGRQVRMFGIPERRARIRKAYWRVLREAGVDVIGTRRPRRLAAFLDRTVPATVATSRVPQHGMDGARKGVRVASAR